MPHDDDAPARLARRSARVLLIDSAERLLLFRMTDGVWMTPGGGVRRFERPRAAAARELWEETGLRVAPHHLGPRVAFTRGHADLGWASGVFEDVFYLHRTGAHRVDTSQMEEHERRVTTTHRWWPVAELATTRESVVPLGLASLLPELLDGRIPAEPLRLPWHHA